MTAKKTKTETLTEDDAGTSFEEDLERLESLVRDLEGGELALEDAFRSFEEGVRLARACRSRLERIEGRVAELLDDGGTRTLTPSAASDDA